MGNTNITKSMIRHLLTGLAAVLTVFGLGSIGGAIEFTLGELDNIWAAVTTLIGVITGYKGFFKDPERLEDVQPEVAG